MVLSLQEAEDAVVGEVGVVGIVLQGMTWGVVSRGTLSGGPNIEHLYSTNRRGGSRANSRTASMLASALSMDNNYN